jgi:hypothetical protein
MASREDIHRLVDAIPVARLPQVEQLLRANLDAPSTTMARRFASVGTLHAEHDLAERSEDILRSEVTDDSGEAVPASGRRRCRCAPTW